MNNHIASAAAATLVLVLPIGSVSTSYVAKLTGAAAHGCGCYLNNIGSRRGAAASLREPRVQIETRWLQWQPDACPQHCVLAARCHRELQQTGGEKTPIHD